MKQPIRVALTSAVLVLGVAQSNAEVTVTNLVQELSVKFTGYYQNDPITDNGVLKRSSTSFSVSNKSLIPLLGLQANTIFSSKARLLLLTPAASPDTLPEALLPRVVIRDVVGGNSIDTDVTSYFGMRFLQTVANTKTRLDPYGTSGSSYDVAEFRMTLEEATFVVQGFAKTTIDDVEYAHMPIGKSRKGTFDVSGYGTYSASAAGGTFPLVMSGTVKVSGKSVEVETQ